MKRRLYVKSTNYQELHQQWGFIPPKSGILFIQCTEKGDVNWEKANLYNLTELLDRGKVKIVKQTDYAAIRIKSTRQLCL